MNKGITLWFTGLSGAGKTTVASALEKELKIYTPRVERLDGDVFRDKFTKELGFSEKDRNTNIERAVYLSEMLTRHGVIVLSAFISPYRKKRDWAREYIRDFMEVYIATPLKVCEERDVKGLYKKARGGEIANFTGISAPYQEPLNPEITIYTHKETIEESVGKIVDELKGRRII